MEKVGAYTERATASGEWQGGDVQSGLRATPMRADYFNMLQRELIAIVAGAGMALSKEDDSQLLQAILSLFGRHGYAVDTGGTNAYAARYSPVPALVDGVTLRFQAKNSNTAASTFNPNGLGALPIVNQAGAVLTANSIIAGMAVWLQYSVASGGRWILVNATNTQLQSNPMDTTPGRGMIVGAGGWLGPSMVDANANTARPSGAYGFNGGSNTPLSACNILSLDWGPDPRWQTQLALEAGGSRLFVRSILKDQSASTGWTELTPSIGVGQNWQDVTSSRASNTYYTNTTGRPIQASVLAPDSGGRLEVNGVTAARIVDGNSQVDVTVQAIVPPGATYRYLSAVAPTLWSELR